MFPLVCKADPDRPMHSFRRNASADFATTTRSSGSKLPRHIRFGEPLNETPAWYLRPLLLTGRLRQLRRRSPRL
ncbi:hypothetical protein C1886_21615 [Pseudomonas sp. FW300-N1A1]|nr:hypothetical protein C1886_21615 [Pseudomonas sp. FW300-N1A1]